MRDLLDGWKKVGRGAGSSRSLVTSVGLAAACLAGCWVVKWKWDLSRPGTGDWLLYAASFWAAVLVTACVLLYQIGKVLGIGSVAVPTEPHGEARFATRGELEENR